MGAPSLNTSPVKRRDMGIAGFVVVVSQLASSFQSSQNVATEIVKFREEFHKSLLDREEFFVRKTEITNLISRLDEMNDHMIKLTEQVRTLTDSYAFQEAEGIVGCSYEPSYTPVSYDL